MVKVDILLPFWGDVELFKKTVASVLAQTESDWRLLIFDDAYPSKEQNKYIESLNDERISYHRHEKNIGITPNFNHALSKASAKYFVMLGCDDILLPNYLEVALHDIQDADFYQPAVEVIDQNGDIYLPLVDRIKSFIALGPGLHDGEKLATSLCHGNWLYFPSILWRTEVVKKYRFNETYKVAEDLDLIFRLILDGYTLKVGDKNIFQYRRFSQSLSSIEKKRGGIRFNEEKQVYNLYYQSFKKIRWHYAACAAKLRLTSRLHEVTSR